MTSLLHLDSSANRTDESISRQLTARYATAWRHRYGTAGYRYRDLVADPIPPIGTAYCALGRRSERLGLVPPADVDRLTRDGAERREWALTRPLIDELLAVDTVLIGAPMYNFSVPVALKAWIDRVSFPGVRLDPATRVVIVTPRGGHRNRPDFSSSYLRTYFHRQGAARENVTVIGTELTLAGLAPHLAAYRPEAARSLAAASRTIDQAVLSYGG